jgi:hypothetical protein
VRWVAGSAIVLDWTTQVFTSLLSFGVKVLATEVHLNSKRQPVHGMILISIVRAHLNSDQSGQIALSRGIRCTHMRTI